VDPIHPTAHSAAVAAELTLGVCIFQNLDCLQRVLMFFIPDALHATHNVTMLLSLYHHLPFGTLSPTIYRNTVNVHTPSSPPREKQEAERDIVHVQIWGRASFVSYRSSKHDFFPSINVRICLGGQLVPWGGAYRIALQVTSLFTIKSITFFFSRKLFPVDYKYIPQTSMTPGHVSVK
jgi:hypothetical protein